MFLKNYTSSVPVSQTIHRIEQILLACGVSGIAKEYGPNQKIVALIFKVSFDKDSHEVVVRLPVKEKSAIDALWRDYAGVDISADGKEIVHSSRKNKRPADFVEQGERTAWKLMQDWVEVQMSMIQLNQATLDEIFLPYLWNGKQTVYERIKEAGLRNLLPERTEEVA
jgi:hypothetical protein